MYNLSFTYQSGIVISLLVCGFDGLCDAIDSRINDLITSFAYQFVD